MLKFQEGLLREMTSERAAIMEHDANIPRAQADAMAITDVFQYLSEVKIEVFSLKEEI